MSDNLTKTSHVLLVGTGYMGKEYSKVLQGMSVTTTVVGHSEAGCASFEAATGCVAIAGGIDNYLATHSIAHITHTIIATSVEVMQANCVALIAHGAQAILVEKPAAGSLKDVSDLADLVASQQVEMYIAYNRRFYASVQHARRMIVADGGVRSFLFEFTEWSHVIGGLEKPLEVKQNWFLGNSTHVIDLAFFMGGAPTTLYAVSSEGSLAWHKQSVFAGSGKSEIGALFAYHANWQGPGRWWLEVITAQHRLEFRPLEKLKMTPIGSVNASFVEIDEVLDTKYKPGLYLQTEAFLDNKHLLRSDLITMATHAEWCANYYTPILHGGSFPHTS
jgi:predicted dehydrogenase